MIVNLSTVVPDGLVCPEGKRRIEYVDKGGIGLYCEVRSTSPGTGTFYMRYKDANGKTCHAKIGRTDDMDLDEARLRAKRLKAEITLGKDPRSDREATKAVPTLDAFFRDHYLPHCKAHNRGWKKKSQMWDLKVSSFCGSMKLNQIKRHDITAWHIGLREDGLSPAYADRFLALLRHAFNMAVEWEMLEKNPAAGVKLFNPDNRIQQYLSEDELKRLLVVLQTDKNRTVCLIILFLLGTGARISEVLQAKWVDIDMDNSLWRIPAASAKSKRSEILPYNSFVRDNVLKQLDSEGKYEYLFVNRRTGKPYTTIHKTWKRLAALAKLDIDFKLHSLRRSYASLVVSGGHSLYQASKLLRHSDPSITASRYAVLTSDSLRSATESVADALNEALLDAANSASDAIKGATAESR